MRYRFLRSVIAGLAVVLIAGAAVWHLFPKQVAAVLLTLNNARAGLVQKVVFTDVGDIHYLEGGQGETVVLIHGIYARKEHWVDFARHLTADYRVIAIDLPGFGDNEVLPDAAYTLNRQKEHLAEVFAALDLNGAHIAANSMGAYVAALMIAENPQVAATFAFIGSPLGVPTPIKSDMDLAIARGEIPLLADNAAAFIARNAWLAPEMPYVPGPIMTTWMQEEVANASENARIWEMVHSQSDAPSILELAPKLAMPTFVLWCSPDRIFHISGATRLQNALPNSKQRLPDNCGHVPMLDQPKQTADLYGAMLGPLE